jgi:hypothetical protein
VSTGIIFAFTHMCIHYLHHIHPPILSSTIYLLPRVPTPPPPLGRTCSIQLRSLSIWNYSFVQGEK